MNHSICVRYLCINLGNSKIGITLLFWGEPQWDSKEHSRESLKIPL